MLIKTYHKESHTMTQLITGLNAIINDYDTYIIDQWGVLHDGFKPLPGAIEALQILKSKEKTVVILSNSGKRAVNSIQGMKKLGFSRDLYDHMVTSGEQVYHGFKNRHDDFYQNLGGNVRLFTFAQYYNLLEDLSDYTIVDTTADADCILASGVQGNDITVYQAELDQALAKNIPMIIANPDKVTIRPDGTLQLCPGTLGELYETMGGTVRWNGKPTQDIYAIVCDRVGGKWTKAIGIGDSLAHDIQGAKNANIDSWLICQGIHRKATGLPANLEEAKRLDNETIPDLDKVQAITAEYGVMPTYVSTYFAA